MKKVLNQVEEVCDSNINVLLTGDTGTGKDLIAMTIHQRSPRGKENFVAVACNAIPETLIESELFGHIKGSFT